MDDDDDDDDFNEFQFDAHKPHRGENVQMGSNNVQRLMPKTETRNVGKTGSLYNQRKYYL